MHEGKEIGDLRFLTTIYAIHALHCDAAEHEDMLKLNSSLIFRCVQSDCQIFVRLLSDPDQGSIQ
jgi:hypothetical protein